MLKFHKSLLLCSILIFGSIGSFAQNSITKVRNAYLSSYHFKDVYFKSFKALETEPNRPISASRILSLINADGSFTRIHKKCVEKDITDTIYRLLYVFKHPDSIAYYQNETVKSMIYNSINYWLNNKPAYDWTGSAMAQPTSLGIMLVKLYDNFEADSSNPAYSQIILNIRNKAKRFLRYSWSKGVTESTFTNPNLGEDPSSTYDWIRMGNLGYRILGYTGIAAACDDSTSIDTLSIMIANQTPLQINKTTIPTGIVAATYDGSLFQHSASKTLGSQFQNGHYGSDYIRALSRYAVWVRDTKWALTKVQQEVWGNILINGMQWISYKDSFTAHNILGRSNTIKGSAKSQFPNMLPEFTNVVDKTIPQYAQIKAMATKISTVGAKNYQIDSTKYFWNSHIILNHSAKYFTSVRMLSKRTLGAESADSAPGKMNFFVSDGSTMLYRDGTEYDSVRVAWNWRCIPGTTVKQKTGSLPLVPWGIGTESDNDIAGGVSDGNVSVGMFKLSRTHTYTKTKATKAYFAYKDALICVGNSIIDTDPAAGSVYTTLNQTQRRTPTYYAINGGTEDGIALGSTAAKTLNITSPSWFWQDSIGYIIIPKTTISTTAVLRAESRSGSWGKLNNDKDLKTLSVNIFQLSIDHGTTGSKKDDTYRYVVVPSVSKTDLINFFNNKILKADSTSVYINYNSTNLVSVSYNGYTGVFFSNDKGAKAIHLGADSLDISSDKPVALLLKRKPDGLDINVSDVKNGFYTNNEISLGINRTFKANSFTPLRSNGPVQIIPVADSSIVKVNTSKVSDLYEGEPIQIKMLKGIPTVKNDSTTTIADAFVQEGYSTTNYGFNSYLAMSYGNAGYMRESYLKFDLHGVKGNVMNAKLRLYSTAAVKTQWDLYKVNDNSWSEGGIIWNNKPSSDSEVISSVAGVTATGYVYFDVAPLLKSLGPDSILSVKIVVPSSVGYIWSSVSSKQSNYPPKILFAVDTAISALAVKNAPVIADAFVKDGTYEKNNYGNYTYMEIKKLGLNYNREGFLKFDLHNVKGKVISAKVKLYSLGSSKTKWQLEKVNDNSWTEAGIKWVNAPQADTLINVQDGTAAAAFIAFDVTNQLQHISPDSLLSLKVTALTDNIYTTFSTKEGAEIYRPYIEYIVDTTQNTKGSIIQESSLMTTVPFKGINIDLYNTAVENNDTEIKVQNVLTPNGDGVNDLWIIKNIEQYPKNWVRVFSRTGKLIYSKTNYGNDWNGQFNGAPLAEGAYIYFIQTEPSNKVLKGTLSVLREQ